MIKRDAAPVRARTRTEESTMLVIDCPFCGPRESASSHMAVTLPYRGRRIPKSGLGRGVDGLSLHAGESQRLASRALVPPRRLPRVDYGVGARRCTHDVEYGLAGMRCAARSMSRPFRVGTRGRDVPEAHPSRFISTDAAMEA